jgi:hypothetical protein
MSVKHSVFVLDCDGKPLTPTTPCRARKLLKAGVAKKVWSKFNTFGIQMLVPTQKHLADCSLGYDPGSKFEGFAIVCGNENNLAIKLNLPSKAQISEKMTSRKHLRRARRNRIRRRPARYANRAHKCHMGAGQTALVQSRLKVLAELFRMFPIGSVGIEDVRFNHKRHRWGATFSAVEIGKSRIRAFIGLKCNHVKEWVGYETCALRDKYKYPKTKSKSSDEFAAHCTDALALACEVGIGSRVTPGVLVVVDDTYRPVRRRLHDVLPVKGAIRLPYSRGNIRGLRKGLLIGARNGSIGVLCGTDRHFFRYYLGGRNRRQTTRVEWISSHFVTRQIVEQSA